MGSEQGLLGSDSLARGQKRDHECGGTDRSRNQPHRDCRRCNGIDAERCARQRQSDVRYSSRTLSQRDTGGLRSSDARRSSARPRIGQQSSDSWRRSSGLDRTIASAKRVRVYRIPDYGTWSGQPSSRPGPNREDRFKILKGGRITAELRPWQMSCMCVAFALRTSTYNVGRLERCASAFGASCLLSFHITSREPDHPTDYALQIVRKQWASRQRVSSRYNDIRSRKRGLRGGQVHNPGTVPSDYRSRGEFY